MKRKTGKETSMYLKYAERVRKKISEVSKVKQRFTLELKQEVKNTLKVSMGPKFRVRSHEK